MFEVAATRARNAVNAGVGDVENSDNNTCDRVTHTTECRGRGASNPLRKNKPNWTGLLYVADYHLRG